MAGFPDQAAMCCSNPWRRVCIFVSHGKPAVNRLGVNPEHALEFMAQVF